MAGKLQGKVAVVTGASKGIGAEIARQLGSEGASVVVNYSSSRSGADAVVQSIVSAGGKAVAVQANLAVEADVFKLFAETTKAFGKLDILVNNAGVYAFLPLEQVTTQEYHRQFDLNVLGVLLASREAAKLFGDKGGNIINISSAIVRQGMPATSIYAATKGAVNSITKSLATELGPKKIRVNSINPGLVETEGVHTIGITAGDFRTAIESQTPLGRIGQPKDIATAALFLASDDSSWLTGESIYISGGY